MTENLDDLSGETDSDIRCDKIDICPYYEHVLDAQRKEYCHSEKYVDCGHKKKVNRRTFFGDLRI